jgi:glutathione S-transferase
LVQEAQQCLKTLQKALEGKKFFGGDAVGYLDIVVGWYARWVPIIEELSATSIVTDQELPLIKAWFDQILAVDVVRETLPPRDKLLPRAASVGVERQSRHIRFNNKSCTLVQQMFGTSFRTK